jgi:hypothetical protein
MRLLIRYAGDWLKFNLKFFCEIRRTDIITITLVKCRTLV